MTCARSASSPNLAFRHSLQRSETCRSGLQPAQALAVEPACRVEQGGARQAERAQRMLEQRQQVDRREARVDHGDQRAQQGRGWRVGQALARRIVDVDLPAPQLGRDAAGEIAIWRYQRRGAAVMLQRFAKRQRDDDGFLVRRGAVGARHVLERGGAGLLPLVARLGRPHQLTDQLAACGVARAAGPLGDGRALAVDMVQQLVQAELRMGGVELLPTRLVHLAVEARQHDGALRQAGDDFQQLARGGLRAGRTGGDDRHRRRCRLPAVRLGVDRFRAPLQRIGLAALGQDLRPVLADDGEELQRAAPVDGEVAVDQRFQLVERHAVDRQLVEQACEFTRELERLRGGLRDRLAVVVREGGHKARQQRLAFGCIDRGWQGERGGVARQGLPFALVEIAERRHARQDRGLAARGAQEGLAQRAHRAAGRHQDQHIGERQRVGDMLGQHAARQLVGEAPVDADGEDALHASTCSASASARGVPTWNHWPSCTRP